MKTWTPPSDWSHRAHLSGLDTFALVTGTGRDVVLLHGWPEYCGVWRRLIPELAEGCRIIAPDLRGFGSTVSEVGPEALPVTPELLASDLLALMDAMGCDNPVIVSHDIGAFVAQQLARTAPERVRALVFFDCPHPAIGARYGHVDHAIETWYQHFHRLPLAEALVGHSPETCRIYLDYFLGHLAGDPTAFSDVLDEWVAVYTQPGRLKAAFSWYEAIWPLRKAMIEGTLPVPAPIAQPTKILWGLDDPVTPFRWSDTLADSFSDFTLSGVSCAGHFPHWQQPKRVGQEIRAFLESLV